MNGYIADFLIADFLIFFSHLSPRAESKGFPQQNLIFPQRRKGAKTPILLSCSVEGFLIVKLNFPAKTRRSKDANLATLRGVEGFFRASSNVSPLHQIRLPQNQTSAIFLQPFSKNAQRFFARKTFHFHGTISNIQINFFVDKRIVETRIRSVILRGSKINF